jgi:thiol-disulfide isomerase/thioredoxin
MTLRPFRPAPIALLLAAGLLLGACTRPAAPPAGAEAGAAADAGASAATAAPPATATVPASTVPVPKPDHPTLSVRTFDDRAWTLAEHRGRWVVVNFWATWCKPCLEEIPAIAAFDASRADVDVIGLAYEEIERPDMVAFLRAHPIPYPIALLDVYAPPADFETPRGLPMTYLIAPDGKVAKTFLGPLDVAELARVIDGRGARKGA